LDPANIYLTQGGKGGTAPLGTRHAEKDRTIAAAKETSKKIRDASSNTSPAAQAPAGPGNVKPSATPAPAKKKTKNVPKPAAKLGESPAKTPTPKTPQPVAAHPERPTLGTATAGTKVHATPMPKAGTARSSAALAKAILSSETMIQNAKAYGRFLERAVAAKQKLDKALQVLQAIDSAEKLLAHGTAMPKEQQEADAVREQSERAKTDAEEQADALSIFEWTVVTGDATRAGDDNGLFAIDAHLIALSHTFEASAKTLTAEADELDVQVAQLGQSMYTELLAAITPDGEDDVSNAIAGATYASLGPLFGAVRAAAQNYRDAAETLNTLALTARDLSDSAEDAAWDVLRMRAEQRYHAEHDRK
jgi:hypothetical protein